MKKKMSIDENFMRSANDPAAMTALLKQNKEPEGVQGFGLKANNKQCKESTANEHGQNVDTREFEMAMRLKLT